MEYTLTNEILEVKFTTVGAECTRVYHKQKKIEYLWDANPKYWARHAPVLFPIVGKLTDNEYIFNNQVFEMSQHGFARDKEFKLFVQQDDLISFYLEADEETRKLYPFDFRLKITYQLKDDQLEITYQVDNLDNQVIYASIGGHPAFNVPFLPNTNFEDYRITIQNKQDKLYKYPLEGMYIDKDNRTLSEKPFDMQITHELFENDALIYETPGKTSIELSYKDQKNKIVMTYDHCDFVGIWSPYPTQAPFVCLEPWNGIADVTDSNKNLKNKFKIQEIAIDSFFRTSYTMKFQS